IGNCAIDFGQVVGSRPVYGVSPKSVSATPSPSVPGSHDATSAPISPSLSPTSCGRPETTRTAHFIAPQTRSIAVRSAALRLRSARPLPMSPTPSAYGVSPTTTTPTSAPAIEAEGSLEDVTLASLPLIADRIDVAPVVVVPEPPCQVIVRPPAWLPMSSAL